MGLDMLEQSDIGSLSSSRLGNKCFINDNDYSNFVLFGKRINFFGDETAKKKTAERAKQIAEQFAIPQGKEKDCEYLNARLTEAMNLKEAALGKGTKNRLILREANPLTEVIGKLKTMISNAKCAEKQAAQEMETTTQRAVQEATKAAETSPVDAGVGAAQSDTTKYLIYGIGGLVVVVTIAMLLKRS